MPIPLSWADIKALTQVGDSPTNLERADVWDSIAYYIQQATDAAASRLLSDVRVKARIAEIQSEGATAATTRGQD